MNKTGINRFRKKIELIESQLDISKFKVVQLSKRKINELGLTREDLLSCWINRDGSIIDSETAGCAICEMDGDNIVRIIKPKDSDYAKVREALGFPEPEKCDWIKKMRNDREMEEKGEIKSGNDPEATELACKLFERITMGKTDGLNDKNKPIE